MQIRLFLVGPISAILSLQAATIQISSDLLNESNNRTGGNVFIIPNPVWATPAAGAGWISYADTGVGSGHNAPPNDTVNSWTTFTEDFFLPDSINSGSLRIWADDSAYVLLDGVAIGPGVGEFPHPAGPSAFIGPRQDEFAEINLTGLNQGAHSLSVSVFQAGNGPFGLLYSGSVGSTNALQVAEAPEPAAFVLLGMGLLGVAAMIRRRRS